MIRRLRQALAGMMLVVALFSLPGAALYIYMRMNVNVSMLQRKLKGLNAEKEEYRKKNRALRAALADLSRAEALEQNYTQGLLSDTSTQNRIVRIRIPDSLSYERKE